MARGKVKGVLFVDYVRMMRARKDVDWSAHLSPEVLALLDQRIEAEAWYPMEAFEQFGLAILAQMPGERLERVRLWGRATTDALIEATPMLVVPGDPRESLMRFFIQQGSYFDFEVFRMGAINDTSARVTIAYGMGPEAEEAAATQAEGFFARLLELAGAQTVWAGFVQASWHTDAPTVLSLEWT